MPVTVLLALLLGLVFGGASSPGTGTSASAQADLPAITVPTPAGDDATVAACAKVLEQLPVKLGELTPRVVHTPQSVAWGNPAIILRCGAPRPAELSPGSAAFVVDVAGPDKGSVEWLPVQHGDVTVFTSIDRAVYVEVTWPKAVAANPLPPLSDAVAAALPAICTAQNDSGPAVPDDQLCVYRK